MPSPRFTRYVLRTTDPDAAAVFYDAVLGSRADGIVRLHESAVARGAKPHWLGQIGVAALGGAEAVAERFLARGATRLGPPAGTADFVVLRDAGGAVVAVTNAATASSAKVVWHQLNTHEPAKAAQHYAELLAWSFGQAFDWGQLGRHQPFAFGPKEASVGLFSDVEGRPGVHTHWLFFFAVRSLDEAILRVKAQGGVVIGPLSLPNGVRVAACDDPQGAAFGLVEEDQVARLVNG